MLAVRCEHYRGRYGYCTVDVQGCTAAVLNSYNNETKNSTANKIKHDFTT
jgi:hypothetical protein